MNSVADSICVSQALCSDSRPFCSLSVPYRLAPLFLLDGVTMVLLPLLLSSRCVDRRVVYLGVPSNIFLFTRSYL